MQPSCEYLYILESLGLIILRPVPSLLCTHSTLYKMSLIPSSPVPANSNTRPLSNLLLPPSSSRFSPVLPRAASRTFLSWFHPSLCQFLPSLLKKKNQMIMIHLPGARPRPRCLSCTLLINICNHLVSSPFHRRQELPAGPAITHLGA